MSAFDLSVNRDIPGVACRSGAIDSTRMLQGRLFEQLKRCDQSWLSQKSKEAECRIELRSREAELGPGVRREAKKQSIGLSGEAKKQG